MLTGTLLGLVGAVSLGHASNLDTIAVDAGRFVMERGKSRVEVAAVRVPAPLQAEPAERSCPVVFGWKGGERTHRAVDCPKKLVAPSIEAAEAWDLTVSDPVDGDLFEVWFRFDTDPYEPPKVFVRRAHDVALTLDHHRLHTLPYMVRQRAFVDYPEAAVGQDTSDRRCRAKVPLSPTGAPRAITVERCDEVFHQAVIDGLKRYRFDTITIDGSPATSALTIGVVFKM